jgi:hypothetical protein
MGERNYILLKNDNIYLYSHWDSVEDLKLILKSALIRGKSRWDDREYLNRIIFSEMIQNSILDLTGYGLSSEIIDGNVVWIVDINNNTIEDMSNKISFEEFIK